MQESHLRHLACPVCSGDLSWSSVSARTGGEVLSGELSCGSCGSAYPVTGGIPRFVLADNYAAGFGLEWNIHARTQYDSYSGVPVSEERFFNETKWPREMDGQLVLEVGSGSGRFTEQAAGTGAFVVSLDYSCAVEANYRSNGSRPNVLIVQGDVFSMPLRTGYFDKLFCFGMLQHTPDPRRAFLRLPQYLKPEGHVVVDIYKRTFLRAYLHSKYYLRPFTRGVAPDKLYAFTTKWVDLMWPITSRIRRIPVVGPSINWRLMVADYSRLGLEGRILREWAYLDTFDMLSPRYDKPKTLREVRKWFTQAGLQDVDVRYGYNGIQGTARKAG